MGPEIRKEISNRNETNVFRDHNRSADKGEASLGNDAGAENGFKNDPAVERVVDNWKRLVFRDNKRLNSMDTEIGESEEIGEQIRKAIRSVVNMDSNMSKEKSGIADAKSKSSPDCEEPDKADETVVLQFNTDCPSSGDGNPQPKKTERRRNSVILGKKRKLNSRKIDNESDESTEVIKKHSRRGSRNLRSLPAYNLRTSVDEEESKKKNPQNESRKTGDGKHDVDELEREDSNWDNGTKSSIDGESQEKNESLILAQIAHRNKILKMLNNAPIAELKSLPRIGPKAAMMIHQHREIHGKLRSIQDLKNMRGWSPRFFEQFLQANDIVLD